MGTPPANPRKKVTVGTLRGLHRKGEPITMITAHDFPSAHVADAAGMDMILVGDSLAMVALGMEDTSEVLLEEMLLHCRSVARATKAAFTVSCSPLNCPSWVEKKSSRNDFAPLPFLPLHPTVASTDIRWPGR
jgi:3-methyl-2-oxobutanoate hydroxymethyltransferase